MKYYTNKNTPKINYRRLKKNEIARKGDMVNAKTNPLDSGWSDVEPLVGLKLDDSSHYYRNLYFYRPVKPEFKLVLGQKYGNGIDVVVPIEDKDGNIVFGGYENNPFRLYSDPPRSLEAATKYVKDFFPNLL